MIHPGVPALTVAREKVAAGTHPITAILESTGSIAQPLILLGKALDRDITSWSKDPGVSLEERVAAFDRAIAMGSEGG